MKKFENPEMEVMNIATEEIANGGVADSQTNTDDV